MIAFCMVLASEVPAAAGLLSAGGLFILDSAASPRTVFSSNERISFQQKVYNAAASPNNTVFFFKVLNPSSSEVFSHQGNAVPGSVGNAAASISGVPISGFFTGPGVYTVIGQASLDGQVISQQDTFTISSPNILLIYPPNGSRDLVDKPLTLRWSSSGAARYRVTVGDSPSFFNAPFSQETAGGEFFMIYPENPDDDRARLASGTVYYWKVEGLDASGNAVAQSAVPFSFSVESATLTRDLSVESLTITGQVDSDTVSFQVVVKNQGGTAEGNQQLKFSIGGIPTPGSPVSLPLMQPGEEKTYNFTGDLPADQGQSLSIACVDFFDDNVANNCKTLQISRQTVDDAAATGGFIDRVLGADEIWEAIKQLLKDKGLDLSDFDLIGIDVDSMSQAELQELLDQLQSGQALFSITGPPADSGPVALVAGGLTPGEVWEKIKEALKSKGLDFSGFGLVGTERDLESEELDELTKQITNGQALIKISGPADEHGPIAVADVEETDSDEWTGKAPPMSEDVKTFEITRNRDWKKAWKRLDRQQSRPKIDFNKYMVVGVMAGSRDKAAQVEIADIRKFPDGLRVRFRFLGRDLGRVEGGEKTRARAPYHLRMIPKTKLDIVFKRIKKGRTSP